MSDTPNTDAPDPEACASSPDGFHSYEWYEQDEPCAHCGTTDLNLWVDGVQQEWKPSRAALDEWGADAAGFQRLLDAPTTPLHRFLRGGS